MLYQDKIVYLQQELEECWNRIASGEDKLQMVLQDAQKIENENHMLREERKEYIKKY
jgi:shikimate kinase